VQNLSFYWKIYVIIGKTRLPIGKSGKIQVLFDKPGFYQKVVVSYLGLLNNLGFYREIRVFAGKSRLLLESPGF